ncbi:MAG: 23S rRNA pseudouridine(1911/1915/1917) synthase RluD [Gammaproteobacteria bacterium]|nr:23S rRNA pseudouridine(1911/1915/1917) synthase RluD [Gammaproteobacteria bacterium]
MSERIKHYSARIDVEASGKRLDQVLAGLFTDFSRTRLQQWVREGRVSLDDRVVQQPREKVSGGETVTLAARFEDRVGSRPQAIPLEILYQDTDLIVLNKPAGLVVHPAAGNPDGTLQNALLYHDPELSRLPRAGIVHRLDKDTTGLLMVARTPVAFKGLVEQLQERTVAREYRAIVQGLLVAGGTINNPIGRHPVHRTRMAVVSGGKPAVTHYRVMERYGAYSYVRVNLETGRTHQIRVHMASIRHPLAGDPVYGGRLRLPRGTSSALMEGLQRFRRQALHACRLGLKHPSSGEWLEWQAGLPEDMTELRDLLRRNEQQEGKNG